MYDSIVAIERMMFNQVRSVGMWKTGSFPHLLLASDDVLARR